MADRLQKCSIPLQAALKSRKPEAILRWHLLAQEGQGQSTRPSFSPQFAGVRGRGVLRSSPRRGSKKFGYSTLDSKNIRTSEAAPVKRGDRQPEQQTLVAP